MPPAVEDVREIFLQAKYLGLLRCDQIQGYLVSKPVSFDDITWFLRDSSAGARSPNRVPQCRARVLRRYSTYCQRAKSASSSGVLAWRTSASVPPDDQVVRTLAVPGRLEVHPYAQVPSPAAAQICSRTVLIEDRNVACELVALGA